MEASKLKEILEKHKMWLNGEEGGERANLIGANLIGANLIGANLRGADLIGANLRGADGIPAICCPEEGSFIGFKKAGDYIVKILILDDAKRSSATTSKCRCDKAKVLEIKDINTGELMNEITSTYDHNFVYKVGEIVSVDDFDENRWNECAPGIHFFVNKENALNY